MHLNVFYQLSMTTKFDALPCAYLFSCSAIQLGLELSLFEMVSNFKKKKILLTYYLSSSFFFITDAAKLLKKTYFSGGKWFSGLMSLCDQYSTYYLYSSQLHITGTVAASIADIDFIKRREAIEELFEDGTVSFLSIASIRHGFKTLNSLTVSAISRYAELEYREHFLQNFRSSQQYHGWHSFKDMILSL